MSLIEANGENEVFLMRAGIDTAVGEYSVGSGVIGHSLSSVLTEDPRREGNLLYVTVIPISAASEVRSIELQSFLNDGVLRLNAMSLLDRSEGMSRPIMLDPDLVREELNAIKIYRFMDALPRASLIHGYEVVANEEALASQLRSRFDENIFLMEAPDLTTEQRSELISSPRRTFADTAQIIRHEPEHVAIDTVSATGGFLLLTDAYYPGWEVRVDGRKKDILQANGMFRAVYVPAGEHSVRFDYRPQSYLWGVRISVITLAILIALLPLPSVWKRRRHLTNLLSRT